MSERRRRAAATPDAPIPVYRIAADTPTYGADDRTGAGAKRTGGRWNRTGTALLCTPRSRALACLETFAHLTPAGSYPFSRLRVEYTIPAAEWLVRVQFDPTTAPGWDVLPLGLVSLDWGTAWAQAGEALVAEVPSVLVPEETNVLRNPAHRAFAGVRAQKVRAWRCDPHFGSSVRSTSS